MKLANYCLAGASNFDPGESILMIVDESVYGSLEANHP